MYIGNVDYIAAIKQLSWSVIYNPTQTMHLEKGMCVYYTNCSFRYIATIIYERYIIYYEHTVIVHFREMK